ncbi:hypothetical protein [Actinorugispora endophytica]|uniref:Uncharacterized protein n=1 Tax=Actinorugispora endophytica TaxID=1605990 RepID=A0A4R6VD35_9ACTN|nr:hypothetical protein [Actinorugispora endophytica]TDQ54897.1 hypothetical protein EV190_101216 [Actinorugispora endophytica]
MTMTTTHRDLLVTDRDAAQDAELASLIRLLAVRRPEIAMGWTPPPAPVPAPAATPAPARTPRPLPWPRLRDPLAPHPVTGRTPTREDFPANRERADSIARLRAIAAGTHRPGQHWPAHATPAYYARKTRPTRLHRALHTLRRALGRLR